MNKVFKITVILIIIMTMLAQLSVTFASQVEGTESSGGAGTSEWTKGQEQKTNWGDIFTTGDDFIKKGSGSQNSIIDENQLRENLSSIFRILTTIGISLSVIIGGILGIKFMMASAEDKAQIKEMLIPYIVGCVVIYGAVTIWVIVIKIMEQI